MTHAFQSLSGGPAAKFAFLPPMRFTTAPSSYGHGHGYGSGSGNGNGSGMGVGGRVGGDVRRSSGGDYSHYWADADHTNTSGIHRWAMSIHGCRAFV